MSNFKNLLNKSKDIGIISHINPDADNLGSLTALAESLRQLGKNVIPISIDTTPYNLYYLYKIDGLVKDYDMNFDMLFILDTSSLDRLGSAKDIVNKASYLVNIDHHFTNDMVGDFDYIDRNASSTGQVLYELMVEEGLPIDKNIAESIYTAISSDTGSFRYDSVNKRTFEIAGELLDYGVDINKINNNLYGSNKISKARFLALAIDRLRILDNLAITYILEEDFKKHQAFPADVEGIVEYIRDLEGIEIAVFLKESKTGFKASTRSKNDYNVAELSGRFGGGGHKKAAGFFIANKNLEEVIREVSSSI